MVNIFVHQTNPYSFLFTRNYEPIKFLKEECQTASIWHSNSYLPIITTMPSSPLILKIQPRIIHHLGIQMYQKAVDVISELVANAWDADASKVEISISKEDHTIRVEDNGDGMTPEECQNNFLQVGRDRRKETGKDSTPNGRPVMGRKGIGKFSGFGIAKLIHVTTTSLKDIQKRREENSESPHICTEFILNISDLESVAVNDQHSIETICLGEERDQSCGTSICLKGVTIDIDDAVIEEIRIGLGRRFLLSNQLGMFKILVNGEEIPASFQEEKEFIFPRDLTEEEKQRAHISSTEDDDAWAVTVLADGNQVKWRVGFTKSTIKDEELRGIAVFARGKMAQKPFFFNHTGGASGQHAFEYMTGQVIMDFIDDGTMDLISTERQRINLSHSDAKIIRDWGVDLVKYLSSLWKERRSQKKLDEINDRISGFGTRLDRLPSSERKIVTSVLKKIASFPRLGESRFKEWCSQILTAWEGGRLKNLICDLSEANEMDEAKLVEILTEADILTSLQIAETIKTKLNVIGELKRRISERNLENDIRDYIYDHPWIIHPKWEQFKKETYLDSILKNLRIKFFSEDIYHGRVDMLLSSGDQLLLIEFMRPGLKLDEDHVSRTRKYVFALDEYLENQTAISYKLENTYVIAEIPRERYLLDVISGLAKDKNIYFKNWDTLLNDAKKQYEEYLDLLKERNPTDLRISNL